MPLSRHWSSFCNISQAPKSTLTTPSNDTLPSHFPPTTALTAHPRATTAPPQWFPHRAYNGYSPGDEHMLLGFLTLARLWRCGSHMLRHEGPHLLYIFTSGPLPFFSSTPTSFFPKHPLPTPITFILLHQVLPSATRTENTSLTLKHLPTHLPAR